jgi:translation initiation factor 1 (eIF-1/SUI1)
MPYLDRVLSEELLEETMKKCNINGDNQEGDGEKDVGSAEEEATEKKPRKHKGAAALKTAKVYDTRVIIARIQRQKRKFVTAIAGLETVPDLRLKDATKVLDNGRSFNVLYCLLFPFRPVY